MVPPTASRLALVVSLVKNIVGAGVLALPACVGAYSDAPRALFPAGAMVVVMGFASAYTFALIARACELTGATTYRGAWARAIGKDTAWMVSLVSTIKTGIGCLMYSMILADAGSSLALAAGLPAAISGRSGALLALTTCVVLPMCFLQSLSLLKYTSFAGICGMFYTIGAMGFRWLEGSYLPGGRFHDTIAVNLQPVIAVHGGSFLSSKAYLLISCLATAFVAHYNAPKYYRELEGRSLSRFYQVVAAGFGGAVLLFSLTMAFGFLTFGSDSAGFILNNYSTEDELMDAARAAISFSILCTYPLLFSSLREGVLEVVATEDDRCEGGFTDAITRRATVMLIMAVTGLALMVRNLGSVAAISGGIFGSTVIYIFPAIIFLAVSKKQLQASPSASVARGIRIERFACRCLLALGVILASVSTASSLWLK